MYSRKRVRKGRVTVVILVVLFLLAIPAVLATWIVGNFNDATNNLPTNGPGERLPYEPTPTPRPTLELAMGIAEDNLVDFLEERLPVTGFSAEFEVEYFWQRGGVTQSGALVRRLYVVEDGTKVEFVDANGDARHVWFSGGRVYEWVEGGEVNVTEVNPMRVEDFLQIPEHEALILANQEQLLAVRREVIDMREFVFVELIDALTEYRYEMYISTDFNLLERARVYDGETLVYQMAVTGRPYEGVFDIARPVLMMPNDEE